MKVLFIVHDVYQPDVEFPLGPAYLSSVLRQNGVETEVYSMDAYHYTNKQLAEFLDKREYDVIGLGFMSARFNETIIELAKVINKHKKKAWFVLGGHGASATPEYMVEKLGVDGVIVGEGENSMLKLMEHRQNNDNKVIYREPPVKNLDAIPFPDWETFPTEYYLDCYKWPGMKDNDRIMSVLSSRGCVNRCAFCYRMEKGIRVRKIDKIIEEMKILYNKYKVKYFLFEDELFVLSKKRLEQFYIALQNANLDIKYICSARVNLIDEELLTLMKNSGCIFINYGFESMNQKVLDAMHKNTTVEQNDNAAKLTRQFEIPFGLNLIWNNKFDTVETLKENKEFIIKYNMFDQLRTIRPVTPYPGCELYYDAVEQGLLKGPDDFYTKFKNSDLIMVNFTDLKLDDMYDALFKTNKELIYDHYKRTGLGMNEADHIIDGFYRLYYEDFYKFRGARHYDKQTEGFLWK